MTAPHCIRPDSITITASIAACIGCWCVATVPTERLCEKVHFWNDTQRQTTRLCWALTLVGDLELIERDRPARVGCQRAPFRVVDRLAVGPHPAHEVARLAGATATIAESLPAAELLQGRHIRCVVSSGCPPFPCCTKQAR